MSALVEADVQRRTALDAANDRRLAGAEVKRFLKDIPRHEASVEAAQLLRDCPNVITHLELHIFLEAVPGVGRERLRMICERRPSVWPFRRIGDLTRFERDVIATRLCARSGWSHVLRTQNSPTGGRRNA